MGWVWRVQVPFEEVLGSLGYSSCCFVGSLSHLHWGSLPPPRAQTLRRTSAWKPPIGFSTMRTVQRSSRDKRLVVFCSFLGLVGLRRPWHPPQQPSEDVVAPELFLFGSLLTRSKGGWERGSVELWAQLAKVGVCSPGPNEGSMGPL